MTKEKKEKQTNITKEDLQKMRKKFNQKSICPNCKSKNESFFIGENKTYEYYYCKSSRKKCGLFKIEK